MTRTAFFPRRMDSARKFNRVAKVPRASKQRHWTFKKAATSEVSCSIQEESSSGMVAQPQARHGIASHDAGTQSYATEIE